MISDRSFASPPSLSLSLLTLFVRKSSLTLFICKSSLTLSLSRYQDFQDPDARSEGWVVRAGRGSVSEIGLSDEDPEDGDDIEGDDLDGSEDEEEEFDLDGDELMIENELGYAVL